MVANSLPSVVLRSRGVLRVQGVDAVRFLQGLLTCDVHQFCAKNNATSSSVPRALPGAFLNPKGRVISDVILSRPASKDDNGTFLLDVPSSRIDALLNHLTRYRLRAKVTFTNASHTHCVIASLPSALPLSRLQHTDGEVSGENSSSFPALYPDPRLKSLGLRAVVERNEINNLTDSSSEEERATAWRFVNGVAEAHDFDDESPPLPLDLGLQYLQSVSFEKGCYLGQELTARSHHTGVLRKRVMPVVIAREDDANGHRIREEIERSLPASGGEHEFFKVLEEISLTEESSGAEAAAKRGTELRVEGKKKAAGKITSCARNITLAVLRLEDVFAGKFESAGITMRLPDGRAAVPYAPTWWPERTQT